MLPLRLLRISYCDKNYMGKLIIICSVISINLFGFIETWAPDIKPKISLNRDLKIYPSFYGNTTDYFKILDQDDASILIGARNHVYNLSLNSFREIDRIEWYSSDADRELCALKGKSEQDCQNYIRVFARPSSTQIMICGTNSYKPRCRYYGMQHSTSNHINNRNLNRNLNNIPLVKNNAPVEIDTVTKSTEAGKSNTGTASVRPSNFLLNDNNSMDNGGSGFQLINEIEAQGRCPYNPQHNSTYIYTDGQLYSATVADFSGADPLIYRETLRTEQYDLKQLNQPAFVSALERNGYVFFFFREIAMEYMNCGKTIYSRVARVCKNDHGGPYAFSDRWTSYLKTRLNCSVPGEYPFYFDEIQSTSKIIDGVYPLMGKKAIVYAVFTTSVNAIPGSAVCAFSIDSILDSFNGNFKYQKDSTSNWLPLAKDDVPEPRPGQCVDDSRTLSSTAVNFVKTHTLMEKSVAPLFDKPLLTRVSLNYRLTAITIDPQVQSIDNQTYDIIFVGTDNGKVIKFINIIDRNDEIETVVIAEMDALPKNTPIRELTVSQKTQSLIVIGDGHIIALPLHYCSNIQLCSDCLNLQDPYCVWDSSDYECKSIFLINSHDFGLKNYIQSLNTTANTKNICKKYGGPRNDLVQPRVTSSLGAGVGGTAGVTRGTVSGTGKSLNGFNDIGGRSGSNAGGNNIITDVNAGNGIVGNDIRSIYMNFKETNDQQSNDETNENFHRITLTSLNPDHLDKTIENPYSDEENLTEKLKLASANMQWSIFLIMAIFIVFAIGILVGWHASRRFCKNSVFHAEHRNQLNPKSRPITTYRDKDVNLLMNTNVFPPPCNNKKDNLEHEFVVSDKDRSHECKNSTENLEKEIHFSKTGTLTKVKRTYI